MMEHKQIHWTLKACVIRCNMCNKVKKLVLFCKCLWCNLWNHSVLLANTGCSKKTRTTLVVNIFRTTNDIKITFGLYDAEPHKVLCTLLMHCNVSSICRAQDIKLVHEFLSCSAQHVCIHQCACNCDPRMKILQVCHLRVVDIFDKPPQKKIKWAGFAS